jgi:hypothetical protein
MESMDKQQPMERKGSAPPEGRQVQPEPTEMVGILTMDLAEWVGFLKEFLQPLREQVPGLVQGHRLAEDTAGEAHIITVAAVEVVGAVDTAAAPEEPATGVRAEAVALLTGEPTKPIPLESETEMVK